MNQRTTIRAGLLLVLVAGLVLGATFLANADEGADEVTGRAQVVATGAVRWVLHRR
jgi:uncharacterized membrane protein YoaK (UPF0700 family)